VSNVCAVELSVWMGVRGCGCPISSSVCRMDTAVLVLMNSVLNLWLTSKSMNRLITNFGAVYLSNG